MNHPVLCVTPRCRASSLELIPFLQLEIIQVASNHLERKRGILENGSDLRRELLPRMLVPALKPALRLQPKRVRAGSRSGRESCHPASAPGSDRHLSTGFVGKSLDGLLKGGRGRDGRNRELHAQIRDQIVVVSQLYSLFHVEQSRLNPWLLAK